ncbi:MAG TPA: DNA-J related domain-containing protein [Marinagarivorans sp.]
MLAQWLHHLDLAEIEAQLFEYIKKQLVVACSAVSIDEYVLIQFLDTKGYFKGLADEPATLSLFAKHFMVRRCCYRLREQFTQRGWAVTFELMHIKFHPLAPSDNQAYRVAVASDALLAEFYDDLQTLAQATTSSVGKLLADFWVKYEAYQRADSAYEVLEVAADASWSDIQQAYRQLAARHHPDKGGDADRFVAIKTAYERLKALHPSGKSRG